MSYDVGGSFNSFADAVSRAPVIGPALASPLWAALLITATAAIVILAVYHRSLRDVLRNGAASRSVRAFVYVLGAVALLTALHYRAVSAEAGASATRTGFRDVVGAAEAARASGSEFPVELADQAPVSGGAPPPADGSVMAGWSAAEPVPNLAYMYGSVAPPSGAVHHTVQHAVQPAVGAALQPALQPMGEAGPGVPGVIFARLPAPM